jgi:Fe-S oxidoreductase
VQVVPVIGAGASLLSKGFLEAAKRHAGKILDALNQLDPQNEAAIVGIEPPEIYTLKHDYLDLIPERKEEIASRAARTWLLDEYLLRSEKFVALREGFLPEGQKQKIKFQPHCHQRAEGLAADGLPSGTNATAELLRMCGYEVELIEAGCCGMAGTFGYEAEHYELSMKVGELKLFPALRTPSLPPPNSEGDVGLLENNSISDLGEVPARAVEVVATGAACRMQIVQGTGEDSAHPIRLVWERLIK